MAEEYVRDAWSWDRLMGFGKHATKTIHWVFTHDHQYIQHCLRQKVYQPAILFIKDEVDNIDIDAIAERYLGDVEGK